MNWVDYLVPFGTAGGGAASVYGLVVRPRQKEHMKRESERDQKRRETDAFLYGVRPIEGVTQETLSAPRRLRAVELSMGEVVVGQKKLEERMNEANGTGRETRDAVEDIRTMIQGLATAGADAKLKVGSDAKELAVLTADSQAALLDAVHKEKT